MTEAVHEALAAVAAALPGGGETRPGQIEMADAVAEAIASKHHLVVQAGTGTGKSLAYLVPVALSGRRVVVATATKALQDQLAAKDLPQVAAALDDELTFALLKGRSNYLCRQRVSEMGHQGQQLAWSQASDDGTSAGQPSFDPNRLADQVRALLQWADKTTTGDRAELDFEPNPRAWAMVSTTARECPGAFRCPSGRDCCAEDARAKAAEADVIVVNTHLYGAHLASGGAVLPPHDVVVFDEAHELEDVMTDSLGVEIGPGRFRALAASARTHLTADDEERADVAEGLAEVADRLHDALVPLAGQRLPSLSVSATTARHDEPDGTSTADGTDTSALGPILDLGSGRVARLVSALRKAEREAGEDEATAERAARDRVLLAAGHLAEDLARLAAVGQDQVVWVDGGSRNPVLRVSPIDVGPLLASGLWSDVDAILTSATVPLGLAERLGLPAERTDTLDVGSPFDYREHAILYVASTLPDRRRPEAEPALFDELATLIEAAGGRTLALFTSWRAMQAAADALAGRLDVPILTQSDLPKPALVEAFASDEATCLFATMGFWQGVDVPGRTLSLVVIDRIPFPRPDDPILQARKELAGPGAFSAVDLPRAGTLLAQGVGRLIRSSGDRGVVAVLDSRLATASYRSALLARVPPMKRSVTQSEVVAFLQAIAADADADT